MQPCKYTKVSSLSLDFTCVVSVLRQCQYTLLSKKKKSDFLRSVSKSCTVKRRQMHRIGVIMSSTSSFNRITSLQSSSSHTVTRILFSISLPMLVSMSYCIDVWPMPNDRVTLAMAVVLQSLSRSSARTSSVIIILAVCAITNASTSLLTVRGMNTAYSTDRSVLDAIQRGTVVMVRAFHPNEASCPSARRPLMSTFIGEARSIPKLDW
mmetsp:Transcript_46227/g.119138  ORF Transcript_46227/g.119138 Transcript_46227/m.119138 type:complete len:209 (+) Transcript_46227:767-1393(+)